MNGLSSANDANALSLSVIDTPNVTSELTELFYWVNQGCKEIQKSIQMESKDVCYAILQSWAESPTSHKFGIDMPDFWMYHSLDYMRLGIAHLKRINLAPDLLVIKDGSTLAFPDGLAYANSEIPLQDIQQVSILMPKLKPVGDVVDIKDYSFRVLVFEERSNGNTN